MKGKILIVDDEPDVLDMLSLILEADGHTVFTTDDGNEAVEIARRESDIALIISDMRMPRMSGPEVLEKIREVSPDTVRIALTGYTDSEMIIQSINLGSVQRFLIKPCEHKVLQQIAGDAVNNYFMTSENRRLEALVYDKNFELEELSSSLEKKVKARTAQLEEAKKEIERNMHSILDILLRLMEYHSPTLVGHSKRVSDLSKCLAERLGLPEKEIREIEIAAMVHDIGQVGMNINFLEKLIEEFTDEEKEAYRSHPIIGGEMLASAAGFANIAKIVRHHHESFTGAGFPDGLKGENIPLGSRIIAIADSYDRRCFPRGKVLDGARSKARQFLSMSAGSKLDENLVKLFLSKEVASYTEKGWEEIEISVRSMIPGMVLSRDIMSSFGKPLLKQGTKLSNITIRQINESKGFDTVVSRIFVLKSSIPSFAEGSPEEEALSASAETQIIRRQGGNAKKPGQDDKDSAERPLIVVVDDEQHVLNALRRELRYAGYDTETFTQPVDALQQLHVERNVYALITDYNMPSVRGDRFISRVQREFPDLPCIVITGVATKDTVINIGKAGKVVRIISKPWDRQELLDTLQGLRRPAEEPADSDD